MLERAQFNLSDLELPQAYANHIIELSPVQNFADRIDLVVGNYSEGLQGSQSHIQIFVGQKTLVFTENFLMVRGNFSTLLNYVLDGRYHNVFEIG